MERAFVISDYPRLDHYRFGLNQSELRSMAQINHLSEYLGSHAIACEPISL